MVTEDAALVCGAAHGRWVEPKWPPPQSRGARPRRARPEIRIGTTRTRWLGGVRDAEELPLTMCTPVYRTFGVDAMRQRVALHDLALSGSYCSLVIGPGCLGVADCFHQVDQFPAVLVADDVELSARLFEQRGNHRIIDPGVATRWCWTWRSIATASCTSRRARRRRAWSGGSASTRR